MNHFEDLKNAFETLTRQIEMAERAVESGTLAPLGTLENTVDTLCRTLKAETPEVAKALQPAMAALIAALDSLAARLHDYTDRLKSG